MGAHRTSWQALVTAGLILAGTPLSPAQTSSAATPAAPRICGLAASQDGGWRLEAQLPASQQYSLQASADLVHWRRMASISASDGDTCVAQLKAPEGERGFYRLAREASMFRFGAQRTGVSDSTRGTNAPVVKWKFPTGKGVFASPTVVGGVVYIGSLDTNFYAIDAASGAEKWRFVTGGPIRATAAVVDGTAYCYSRDGFVHALNAATGQEIWRGKIAETNQTKSFDDYEYFDSSPAVVDQVLYIGSGDKCLHAIDTRQGQPLWTFPANSKISSPPAVVNGVVYFGVTDGNFHAVDAATGTNLWKFKTQGNPNNGYPKGDVLHAPVVVDGTVYFGSRDSAVYALDAATGKKKWRRDIMGGNNWAANSPAVWRTNLFIGSSITGALVAIDTVSGKQLWQVATYKGLAEYSSPVVAGGVAYFGIGDVQSRVTEPAFPKVVTGYVQAVDLATHKELWRLPFDGHVWSSPAVVEGRIYFGCLDGNVYALE